MSVDRIAALLTRTTGLAPTALGSDAVGRAVRRRREACGLDDDDQYEEKLRASVAEWQALVDEVVVRETWFFRHESSFAFLQRHVAQRWLPRHPSGVLRVLSVPCATGEEPCSIAITLLEAGLAQDSFQVDAVDVSRAAIARCHDATYAISSFRGGHSELRGRYFVLVEGGYRPLAQVTANIRYQQGNLLAANFAVGRGPYDIVFCRNLLIYFDLEARKTARENLYRLLADDGVLLAGHTETTRTLGLRFTPVEDSHAFAYRKAIKAVRSELPPDTLASSGRVAQGAVPPPSRSKPVQTEVPPPLAPVEENASLLETAGRLADEGSLGAAASLCRKLVEGEKPCADAYCLLGLIEEARGNRFEAEACYTRALYLDPEHYESLVHLILLLETRGDATRVAALRARAVRCREGENRHAD